MDSWVDVRDVAIAQNIYPTSKARGLRVRYVASTNSDAMLNNFGLSEVLLRIIAIMSVGYKE